MPRRKHLNAKSPITKLREECRVKIPHFRIKKPAVRVKPPLLGPLRWTASKPSSTPRSPGSGIRTPSTIVDLTGSPPKTRAAGRVPSPELPSLSLGSTARPVVADPVGSTLSPSVAGLQESDDPLPFKIPTVVTGDGRTRRKLTKKDCLLRDWERYEKGRQYNPTFFDKRPVPSRDGDDDSEEDIAAPDKQSPHPFNSRKSPPTFTLPPPRKGFPADFDTVDYVDNDGFVEIPGGKPSLSEIRRKKFRHPKYRRFDGTPR